MSEDNCAINPDDDYNFCYKDNKIHQIFKYYVNSFHEAFKILLETNSDKSDLSSKNFEEFIFIISSKSNKYLGIKSFLYNLKLAQAISITFQTSVDKNNTTIFWRLSGDDKFKSVDLDGISTDFCRKFLAKEIKNGRNGILEMYKNRSNLDLKHLGSKNGQNLLILASINNERNVAKNLLDHKLDVNHKDISGCNAIEIAWENYLNIDGDKRKIGKIMLNLLQANSKFPRARYTKNNKELRFDFTLAPEVIKNFIIKCENIHDMCILSEYDKIEQELAKEPNMKYFYNRNNKSLMAHAISSGKIPVCRLLISLKVSIGHHEVNKLDELYDMLEDPQKDELQSEHRLNAIELPKSHISTLLMLSKIAINDRQHEMHWKCIEEAYKTIDTDESCSKILKIAAIFKMFTIYFDFEHEIVYYLDPKSSSGSLAKIYGITTVYIGAKNLTDDNKKYEVYGAIIHELCHFAVMVTYLNNFNPYPVGESGVKSRYAEVVEQCIINKEIEEDIVGSVLGYKPEHQDSEFIVRVVQMLMHYYSKTSIMAAINLAPLQQRREKFEKLFAYFKKIVEKDFDDLLKIFGVFLDDKQNITYDQLTGPWKAYVLQSKINFQGQLTPFYGVIDKDSEILNLITPKQIRALLWDGKSIEVADKIESNKDLYQAERNFIDFNSDVTVKKKEEIKNFDDIILHVQDSQTFVLADAPGAGKTTAFKSLAYALKLSDPSNWIALIELRKFQDIFKKFEAESKPNIIIEQIVAMLLQILKLELIEAEVFKKLFLKNKVILLFDAIDEISPHFNKFIIDVLQQIQETTQNQILVSTRPQHAKQLSQKLKAKPFRLVPLLWKEKESFILKMLKESDNFDEDNEEEVLNDFKIFFKSIKNIGYFNYDIDNPLMVKIITELYIDGQIDLKKQSLDLYEIFEKIELSHKKQVDSKVAFEDRDPFSTISLELVHQALALILLYSMHREELKPTYIMGTWNENKKDLTAERIQRYGFVRIGLDFKENDSFALDFTHRTYAEFFVAKFILTFLFKIEDYMKDEELEKVIKVIKMIVNLDTIDNIFGFIMCYMKNEAEGRRFILKNRIKKLILKEFKEMQKGLFYEPDDEQLLFLKFFSVFFIREQKVLSDFWLLDKERNMLRIILIETHILGYFKLQNVMETLSNSFGPNWHEIFNRSNQKLIKDEEIEEIEENQNFFVKQYNRNLCKFLDYFEENFTTHEKVTICKNDVFIYESVELIEINLMKKLLLMYSELSRNNSQILVDILISFVKYTTDEGILMYLADNLKSLLNDNIESMREVLYHDYQREHHPLFKAVKLKNSEIFQKFRILFETCKASNDSIKNIFASDNNLLYFTLLTPNKMSNEIFLYLKEIYGPDYLKLIQSLEPRSDLKVLSLIFEDKKKFKSVKKLIMCYYNNNESKTKGVLKHLLTFGHLSFCAPLMPAIRKRNVQQFENNLRIYDDYEISWKNVTNLNIIINISMELFLNMTKETYEVYKKFLFTLFDANKDHVEEPKVLHTFRVVGFSPKIKSFENPSTNLIAKCIYHYKLELLWNEDKFNYFEKFLFEYFEKNEDQAREILNLMLFCDEYSNIHFCHPFVRPIEKGNAYEFNRIAGLYEKYKSSDKELRKMFKSTNIFCTTLYIISNEIYPAFLKLIQTTFNEFKEQLLDCINHMVIYNVISDREKFVFLQKFLTDFFENDENLKLEFMRKILFFKYSGEIYPLLKVLDKNNIDHLKEVLNIYKNYKLSWEEIQIIYKRSSFLISMFNRVTEESYKTVTNFMKEVFGANLELLAEIINENCANYKIMNSLKNMNKFKLYESFIFDIFTDNQVKAKECIKSILFCKDNSPVSNAIREKDLNELKFYLEIFKNYSDDLKEIQENFIACDIFSVVFTNYMSDEMYEILKKFLLEIFSSNLRNFKKFIGSADIMSIIKNEEKFKMLENLIFEYFNSNELLSKDLINYILYKNCDGSSLEIDQDTPFYQFERFKNIYIKYKNSWSEFFDKISKLPNEIFDSLKEFMIEVFESNDELIINCFGTQNRHEIIGNADNYKSFKIFLLRYFDGNNYLIIQFLEEFLHNEYENSPHPLLSIIEENDFFKCSTASQVYAKYPDYFKSVLLTTNVFFKILNCLGDNAYDSILELMKSTFISDKSELNNCMNNGVEYLEIWKEVQFENFNKFLTDFFKVEIEVIRICIRKVLFYNYDGNCHPIVKVLGQNDLIMCQKLPRHYIEYTDSNEELQIILNPILSCIFNNLTDGTYPIIEEFIMKSFGTEKILEIFEDFMSENDFLVLSENGKKFWEKFRLHIK